MKVETVYLYIWLLLTRACMHEMVLAYAKTSSYVRTNKYETSRCR